ncbi:class F sortase, partial [Streptomyces sp. WAC08241]
MVVVLVVGGFWWAGGEEPAAPSLASAPAAGAPAALDHKAKPEAPPERTPPSE